jgi:hypothetical protein
MMSSADDDDDDDADCPSHPNLVWDTNLVPPWTEPSNCRHERSQPQPRVCVDSYEVILPSEAAGLILRTPIARMDWLSNAFGFDIFLPGFATRGREPYSTNSGSDGETSTLI